MDKLLGVLPQRGNSAFEKFCDALQECEIEVPGFNV